MATRAWVTRMCRWSLFLATAAAIQVFCLPSAKQLVLLLLSMPAPMARQLSLVVRPSWACIWMIH